MLQRISRQWLVISFLTVLTTACGGGGSGGSNSSSSSSSNNSSPSASPSPSPTPASPAPSPFPPPSSTPSYSVRISWAAPVTRADGSALPASAVAGYRLFYTRDNSDPSQDTVISIENGRTASTIISLSVAGTYTFAITAIDSEGTESALSSPVTVSLN